MEKDFEEFRPCFNCGDLKKVEDMKFIKIIYPETTTTKGKVLKDVTLSQKRIKAPICIGCYLHALGVVPDIDDLKQSEINVEDILPEIME